MKVKTSITKRSLKGYYTRRRGYLYFIDPLNPKLNQRQGRNTSRGKKKKK